MGRKHKQKSGRQAALPPSSSSLNLDSKSPEELKQMVAELYAVLDRKSYKLKRLRDRDVKLGKLTDAHEEQILQMEEGHDKAFDRLEHRHEKELEKLEARHELELDELEAHQDREVERLEEKYDNVFSDGDYESENDEEAERSDVE